MLSIACTKSVPRACGDGPDQWNEALLKQMCAPHARGWTAGDPRLERKIRVCPACAGMDLWWCRHRCRRPCVPRMRGDGPS